MVTVLVSAGIIIILELVACYILFRYKKKFQWLISERDELPTFSRHLVEKYIDVSFDSEIGWLRKPETKGIDLSPDGNTVFTINSKGARSNVEFDNKASEICVFGDSYTFCRLVNDHETWPYHLSCALGTNVENYGVGVWKYISV